MKKAQVSVEFTLLVGFLFIIFISIITLISIRAEGIYDSRLEKNLLEVGDIIEHEVSLASKVSDGYQRVFTLPQNLDGLPYGINYILTSETGVINISYSEDTTVKHHFIFVSKDINVSSIRPGKNIIKRENDVVSLEWFLV